MNNVINNLNLEKCLFVDIETAKGQKDININSEEDNDIRLLELLKWTYRNKETDEYLSNEEVRNMYLKRGALIPEIGRIVCISVGLFTNSGVFRIKSFYGDDEYQILKQFTDTVKAKDYTLVGHNIVGFDLPYIRKRYFSNGLENYLTESKGNDSNAKPWDLAKVVIDTMDMWKGTTFTNTGLDLLTYTLGIPSPKTVNLKGSEVSDAYYDGKINDIVSYCERDVVAVANVVRRWKGLEVLEESNIQSVTKYDDNNEKEFSNQPSPVESLKLIDSIRVDGKISKSNMKKLLDVLDKEKLNIDKTKVIDILNSALAYNKNKLSIDEVDLIMKVFDDEVLDVKKKGQNEKSKSK